MTTLIPTLLSRALEPRALAALVATIVFSASSPRADQERSAAGDDARTSLRSSPSARAGQEQTTADDDDRASGGSARVRSLEGSAEIERYEDDAIDDASVNAPLFSGDALKTRKSGRVELQLGNGTTVRIDSNSRVALMSLPGNGEADESDATLLQLSDGSLQIEVRGGAPRKGDFQIDTAAASIYLLANGRYRIDIQERDGATRVSTYRGVAEVVGDEGSVMLRSGQRTFVEEHNEPDDPRSFNTASNDDFDAWVQDRSGEYRRAGSRNDAIDDEQIPDPVRPYYSELSYYGRWITIPQYGPCWIPTGAATGWRPYFNGYWAYGPRGAFWVSYDPWGWAPYHYGRWSWYSGYGWVWVPGNIFAGAWVSWYYGPSHVGWCPLDYWDNPCWTGYGSGFYDYHCWNFVTYSNIYVRHVTKVYVNPTIVRIEVAKGHGVVVRQPVRIRPTEITRGHLTPALIVKHARGLGTGAVIDQAVPRDRAPKRAFKEKEREIVRAAAEARRNTRPGKAGPAIERVRPHTPGAQEESAGRRRSTGSGQGAEGNAPRSHEGRNKGPGAGGASPDRRSPKGRPAPRSHGSPSREPAAPRSHRSPDRDSQDTRPAPRSHRSPDRDSQDTRPAPRSHGSPDRDSRDAGPAPRRHGSRDRGPDAPSERRDLVAEPKTDDSTGDGISPDQSLREFMRGTGRGRHGKGSDAEPPPAPPDRNEPNSGGSDEKARREHGARSHEQERDRSRPEKPRPEQARPEPPRAEPPRAKPPRAEPPRAEPPRAEAPRPAKPQAREPDRKPREAERPRAEPKPQPRPESDRHGDASGVHGRDGGGRSGNAKHKH